MASASFVSSASSFTTTSGLCILVDLPGSISASNLLLVGLGARNANAPSPTPPAGWTDAGLSASDGATGAAIWAFYRAATGLETATCLFVISASDQIAATALQYTNVDTANPIDAIAAASAGGNSASMFLPRVTTTAASEVIAYFGNAVGALVVTEDAAVTVREEVVSTGTNNTTTWAGEEYQVSAGLSTARVNELNSSQRNVSLAIALTTASAAAAGASTIGLPDVAIQMRFSGSTGQWVEVTDDVLINPGVSVTYGIRGNGPSDRVADTGTMSFALNNAQNNSAKKLGYYSPGHANCRTGFELGIDVRMTITYSGSTFVKFVGRMDTINVEAGEYYGRKTYCTAADWIDEASRHKLQYIALQTNVRSDQAASTVITNVPRLPVASTLYTGQDTWPYALDGNAGGLMVLSLAANSATRGEKNSTEGAIAISELSKICQSEMGYLYIKGNSSNGGELVFEDRRVRQDPTLSASISASMVTLKPPRSRNAVLNRIYSTAHPRTIDASPVTVLYTISGSPLIPQGGSLFVGGPYSDPALRSQRVSGTCMVAPAACVDYIIGTGPGDNSETENFSVTACYGANSVQYSICRETGGSLNAFVNFLQARGAGIYDYTPDTYTLTHINSTACLGSNYLSLDFPYESRSWAASAFGDYVLAQTASPIYYTPNELTFIATGNHTLMLLGLQQEPGDLISVTESVTGMAASQFFINGAGLRFYNQNTLAFSWLLQRRTDNTNYWQLNVDKLSEDSTDSGSDWSVLGI